MDLDSVKTLNTLSGSWQVSLDQHSNVADYLYSIGSSPGLNDVYNWTSSFGSNSVSVGGLNLIHQNIYYFNVRAENGAGLLSGISSSDGIKVDTVGAVIGVEEKYAHQLPIKIFPIPFKDKIEIEIFDKENCVLDMTDALGRRIERNIIRKETGNGIKWTISTGDLENGIYFIRREQNGKTSLHKVVK